MVATGHITQASSSVLAFPPLFLRAPVVNGMRRGGKELGIPTGIPHVCNFIRFDFVAFHVTLFHAARVLDVGVLIRAT